MSRDALPLNAIDTCVFIEAILPAPSETRQICYRYLRRLGETFRFALTAPLAFEVMAIGKKNRELGEQLIDSLTHQLGYPENIIAHPEPELFSLVPTILAKDPRLDPLDAFHLAAAIDARIPVFVTSDSVLLRSEAFRDLPLAVLHPKALLGRQPRWPPSGGARSK